MFQRLFILLLLWNVLLFSSVRGHNNLTEIDDPAERYKRSGVIDSLQKVFNSWFKGTTTESEKLLDGNRKKRKEPEVAISYLNSNDSNKETEPRKFIELNENDYNENSYNVGKDGVLTEDSLSVLSEEEKDAQNEDDEEEEIMGKETRKENGNFTELEEGSENVQDLGELLDLLTPCNNTPVKQIKTGIKKATTNSYSEISKNKKIEESVKDDVEYAPNQPGITLKSISDRIPYCKEFWASLGNQLQKTSQKGSANTTDKSEKECKLSEPSRQKYFNPRKLDEQKSTEQVIIQASELNFFFLRKFNSEENEANKLSEGKHSNLRQKMNMRHEITTGKEELEEEEMGKQELDKAGKKISPGWECEENTDGNVKEIDKEWDGDEEEKERILEAMNTPLWGLNELNEMTQIDEINDYSANVLTQYLTTTITPSLVSPKPELPSCANSNQTSVKPWYLKMIPDLGKKTPSINKKFMVFGWKKESNEKRKPVVNGTIFSITREHYHSKTTSPQVLSGALMKISTLPSIPGEDSTMGFPSNSQESYLLTKEISLQTQAPIFSLPNGIKDSLQEMENSNTISVSIHGTEAPSELNNLTSNSKACCTTNSSKLEEISSTEIYICLDWFYKPRFLEIGEAESMVEKTKTFSGKKEHKSRSVVEAWNSFFPSGMPKNKTIRSFWDLWRKVDKINFIQNEGCVFFGDEGKSLPHPMETLVSFCQEDRSKSKDKPGKKTKRIKGVGMAALGNESLGLRDSNSLMKIVKDRLKFSHHTQPSVIIYSEPKKIILSQSSPFINQRNKKYGSTSHNTNRGISGHSSIAVSENYSKPKLRNTTQTNLSMPKNTFSRPIVQRENKMTHFRKGFKSNKEKTHISRAKSRSKKLKMGKNAHLASESSMLRVFKSHKFVEGRKHSPEKMSPRSAQVDSGNATLQAITTQSSSIGLHSPSQNPLNKLKSQEIYLMKKSLKCDKWNGAKLMESKNISTPLPNRGINLEIKNNTCLKEEITTNYSSLAVVSHAQDIQMTQVSILAATSHQPIATKLVEDRRDLSLKSSGNQVQERGLNILKFDISPT